MNIDVTIRPDSRATLSPYNKKQPLPIDESKPIGLKKPSEDQSNATMTMEIHYAGEIKTVSLIDGQGEIITQTPSPKAVEVYVANQKASSSEILGQTDTSEVY